MFFICRAIYTYCENVTNENGNIKFQCRQYSPKIFDIQIAAMKLQTEVRKALSECSMMILMKEYLTGKIGQRETIMGYIFE